MKRIFIILGIFILLTQLFAQVNDLETIVFPYRQIHRSNSNNDGLAFNEDIIYLATKFDGHIYEYNYMTRPEDFIDKFKPRSNDKNLNSIGAMVYHNNRLYAATSFAFERVPQICIFNTTTSGDNILPMYTLDARNSATPDKSLQIFFDPLRIGNYIYWGCCHSEADGPAKILQLNISDDNYVDTTDIVIKVSNKVNANKIYSLAVIENILFASTESGQILRFQLNRYTGQIISEMSQIDLRGQEFSDIQHIEADPGATDYLWACGNENSSKYSALCCIENPTLASYTLINASEHPDRLDIENTRIYLGPGRYLYGCRQGIPEGGFKIKRNPYSVKKFEFVPISDLRYSKFGSILGGNYYSGKHYLFGEDWREGLENFDKIELRIMELKSSAIETAIEQEINNIKQTEVGTILTIFDSDGNASNPKLYTSTYQIGYLFSLTSDLHNKTLLKNNHNTAFSLQADVIRGYQKNGDVLFGIYGGTAKPARLLFYDHSKVNNWKFIEIPKDADGKIYRRIESIAIDEASQRVFIGTGVQTFNKNTPQMAAIFAIDKSELEGNSNRSNLFKQVDFDWPADLSSIRPRVIISMAYHDNHLYCISYHNIGSTIANKFFRINLNYRTVSSNDIYSETSAFGHHKDKNICVDDSILLVGFGAKVLKYDLNSFSINSPDSIIYLGSDNKSMDIISGIVSDSLYYYICQGQLIQIFNKNSFNLIRQIQNPRIDDYFISLVSQYNDLYAASHNGFIYKFEITSP
jgi:hypothetical protein